MPGDPRNLIFKFEVAPDGKFTFDPPGDWGYTHVDHITFESPTGGFTVELEPITSGGNDPVGSPVTAAAASPNGPWRASAQVDDGLTPAQRLELISSHSTPEKPEGFVAHYRYKIAAVHHASGKEFQSDEHNGVHCC